jgi:Domain of unknown function (DUF4386)
MNNESRLSSPSSRRWGRWAGILLIVEAVLAFVPLAVMSGAIGWPASLGAPASEQLTAIHREAQAVRIGYGSYLLYSLLIAPAMILLALRVLSSHLRATLLLVVAFAGISVLARCVGILRWLTVMPLLAANYAVSEAPQKAQIEIVFSAITAYGGGIGELLGVSLTMAIAMLVLCVGALQSKISPKVFSVSGIVVALLLAALALPTFGLPKLIPIALAATALSIWMLCVGLWCIIRKPPSAY